MPWWILYGIGVWLLLALIYHAGKLSGIREGYVLAHTEAAFIEAEEIAQRAARQ